MLEVKFPSAYRKSDKIAGLHWRFKQYRLKLPLHRATSWPYSELWYQVENFTEDLKLLTHDDALDTLAMSNAKGLYGHAAPAGPDTHLVQDPIAMLRTGDFHYDTGISVMSGINASEIPDDVLEEMRMSQWEDANDEEIEREPEWINYQ